MIDKVLGEGTYGIVYLTKSPRGSQTAAKKMLETGPMWGAEVPQEDFFREVAFIRACDHTNVMTVDDHYFSELEACSVMPVMTGNLSDVFRRNRERGMTGIKDSLTYMQGVFEGVAYLHDNHFLHLDLKPDNVLVDRHAPKISDFGLARRLLPGKDRDLAHFTVQTSSFRAPEVWEWQYATDRKTPYQVSTATDNWSAVAMCTKILDAYSFADYVCAPLLEEGVGSPKVWEVFADAGLSTFTVTNAQQYVPNFEEVVGSESQVDPQVRDFYDYVYKQLSLPPDLRASARSSASKLARSLGSKPKARGIKVPVAKPPPSSGVSEGVRKARRWINGECKRLRAADPRWFSYIRDQAKVIYGRLVEAGSRRRVKDAVASLAISILLYSSVKYPTLLAGKIRRHSATVADVIRCVNVLAFDLV